MYIQSSEYLKSIALEELYTSTKLIANDDYVMKGLFFSNNYKVDELCL